MDDMIDASNDIEKLVQTRDEIDKLIGQFGFSIKEWLSNDERLGQVREEMKVLGIHYKVLDDELRAAIKYNYGQEIHEKKGVIGDCWVLGPLRYMRGGNIERKIDLPKHYEIRIWLG